MTPAFLIPKDVADPVLLDHALPIEEAQFGRGGLASTVEDCEAAPLPKRCLQLQKCSFFFVRNSSNMVLESNCD